MQNITIIGAGNQGVSWGQNLSDSGWDVLFVIRSNSSQNKLQNLNLKSIDQSNWQSEHSKLIALLIPDDQHHLWLKENAHRLLPQTILIYAHGFSMETHKLQEHYPQFQHVLLAPKAIATQLREHFLQEKMLGAVYSVEFIAEKNKKTITTLLKHLALDLGITHGPYEVSFKQEMQADLLSEQALLCSIIPMAAKASFDLLIKNGIPAELAYLECWQELKLITSAMVDAGPAQFFELISPNALIGAHAGKQLLIDDAFYQQLNKLWMNIENGQFQQELSHTSLPEMRNQWKKIWENSSLQTTHQKMMEGQ